MKFTKIIVRFRLALPKVLVDAVGLGCGFLFILIGLLLESRRDADGRVK